MSLMRASSPHHVQAFSSAQVMRLVLLALLPGIALQSWFFGWGLIINLIWASVLALGFEALILQLRRRPLGFYLKDGSALLTAWLLAIALPPLAPFWLTAVAIGFAIIFGKQLYGGLGYNPFNPAMLGYVLVLISFPAELTRWLPAQGTPGIEQSLDLVDTLHAIFPFIGTVSLDGMTMATPLDLMRSNNSLTVSELFAAQPGLAGIGGIGWVWVNLAYLAGGLFLLYRRVFRWHAPVGFLLALGLMSLIFWNGTGTASNGSPLFHLFSGATMLGAFFIITDPVSGATSNRGRLIFGLGAGTLVYIIRSWGGYPDAVAFSCLLMNMTAPAIDYYTQPRTFGHHKANRGLAKSE